MPFTSPLSPSVASRRTCPPFRTLVYSPPSLPSHARRRTTHPTTASSSSTTNSVIIPTRGQAELDEQNAGDGDDGGVEGKGDRRSEPRTLEEAGPLQVLYRGHELLVINKVSESGGGREGGKKGVL